MLRAIDDLRARCALVLCLAAGLVVASPACSEPMELGAVDPDAGGQGPVGFEVTSDASAPEASTPLVGMCASDKCPADRVTCPNNPFPCAVDLSSDDDNCGACGHHCPDNGPLGLDMRCVDGACVTGCQPNRRDCNGLVEDGCEATTTSDVNNCGDCGVVCPPLHKCVNGTCECSVPNSCGACGNVCPPPAEPLPPFPPAWNVGYHCDSKSGKCHVPSCKPGFADCNGDFPAPPDDPNSDGCETNIGTDTDNCGACGVACAPGEECGVRNGKRACMCRCGSICFDTSSDTGNCGGCNINCGQPVNHDYPVCENGVCEYRCDANWLDCDENRLNGCETNALDDPNNCGGCGIRCNAIEGQACVNGRCATEECEVTR